jgi:hypothetical protein
MEIYPRVLGQVPGRVLPTNCRSMFPIARLLLRYASPPVSQYDSLKGQRNRNDVEVTRGERRAYEYSSNTVVQLLLHPHTSNVGISTESPK